MRNLPTTAPHPAVEFADHLASSLVDGTLVRLVISGPRQAGPEPERLLGRGIELKGELHLSVTSRYATRDEVRNLPIPAVASWAVEQLQTQFRNGLLCTTRGDWQFNETEGRRPRLVRHKASMSSAPGREHDRPHQSMLDESARDWLTGLGVLNPEGGVRATMAAKHSQISRYLEILSHLLREAGWNASPEPVAANGEWTIADMGCGKGYLTFGLWHLCRRVLGFSARVLGIERRAELVDEANKLAALVGAMDLQFISGSIESVQLPQLKGLIALHACDTATDEAIRRGIGLGAELIVLAPCCQKELRPQLGHPEPLAPILEHGIMEERMAEWVTDGLRALFLEWAGYRTKMFEFVSSEHTPKNLMIAAIRTRPPFADSAARQRIVALKEYFRVRQHALDSLLIRTPDATM